MIGEIEFDSEERSGDFEPPDWPLPRSVMNCATASRNARCCCGVSLSQSRQNDARTSRVGIERLRALVQLR